MSITSFTSILMTSKKGSPLKCLVEDLGCWSFPSKCRMTTGLSDSANIWKISQEIAECFDRCIERLIKGIERQKTRGHKVDVSGVIPSTLRN